MILLYVIDLGESLGCDVGFVTMRGSRVSMLL